MIKIIIGIAIIAYGLLSPVYFSNEYGANSRQANFALNSVAKFVVPGLLILGYGIWEVYKKNKK
jgi:hypothetical protein